MNTKLEEFKTRIAALLDELGDSSKDEICGKMLDILFDELGAYEQTLPPASQISAEHVRLAVTDKNTGRVCVRSLPMSYAENHNGISLSGENLSGEEVKIVYLSSGAIEKIRELRGEGANSPRCHD